MIDKFNDLDNSKKVPIVIGAALIFIIVIIIYAVNKSGNSSYGELIEDASKDYVYTVNSVENDSFFIYVPYVNINGMKSVNEDINSYMEEFIDEKMVRSTYEYEVNGKVLSLVIKTVNYDVEDVPEVYFKTYNINLDTRSLVSDAELLSAFAFTTDDVSKSIEKQFEYWYNDLIKEEYIDDEECDYECFLGNRDVEDYMDNISYYIEKGNLVVYKPFVFYSIVGEEYYFKESDYKFIIEK